MKNAFARLFVRAWLPPTLCSMLGMVGCASSQYLARVNGDPITGEDLKREFTRVHGGHGKFLLGDSETRQFLGVVIDQTLLTQEAERLDLQNQPDIKKAVAEFEERKATDYLVKTEIEDKARPTQDEIRTAWQTRTTRLYRTRRILLDTREEAESVYQRLALGEDFEGLARQCSIDASRIYGGRLPYLGWGAMEPAWETVVFALQPPEISPVFATKDGWEIVQLEDVQPVDPPDLDQAARRIDGILKKRKLDERRKVFSVFLWSKYHARRSDIDLGPESLHAALKEKPGEALVSWDGGRLTVKQFVEEMNWRELAGLLPGRFRTEIEERLRETVNGPLAAMEAKARGLASAPEVAMPVRAYRDELMERVLYADYVLKDVKVTDAEIDAYYASHKADYTAPEKRRVAHIVVATQEEALELKKRLDAGESFAELGKTYSTDTSSAKQAGDLGWITKKDASGEFASVFSFEQGQVSEPLKSKYGWHLIKVEAIAPPKPMSLEDARGPIRKTLTEEKQRDARAVWVKKLRDAATIQISDAGIRQFLKSNAE
jgi:parvulin-like peptidyl-prolyl isomerase